jgi:hypothetical protein
MSPLHTAATEIGFDKQMKRETIDTGYVRVRLGEARVGDGYRLSHSRMRTPTTGGGDTWVSNYKWDLPKGGLTSWEVQDMLSRLDQAARRRYQLKKQKMACRRRKRERWHQSHEEPDHTVETEHVQTASGTRALNRITS